MTENASDTWSVAGRTFASRLIVGTGKYADYAQNAAAAEAAGAEVVTVALRRVNLSDPSQPMLVDHVKPDRFTYLPNTAGCFTGEDAVRTLRLAREAGGWDLVKLEVLSNTAHLYPDMVETLRALDMLVKDGFDVMVYCTDDVVMAKRLEEAGASAIMPAAAPIGSGLGIQNEVNIRLIVEQAGRAGAGGRRRRHGVRCDPSHGAGLRRGSHEHRHRRRQGPDPHGARHETCGDRGPRSLSGGADGQAPVRRSVFAPGRPDLAFRRLDQLADLARVDSCAGLAVDEEGGRALKTQGGRRRVDVGDVAGHLR